VLNISLDSIDHNSYLGIFNFEELDLNNSFRVEAFNYITLLCSINLVRLNCQSDVLCFSIRIIATHDIVIIVLFRNSPLSFFARLFDILLDVIKNSSWLDIIGSIDIDTHNIVECCIKEAILPDQI